MFCPADCEQRERQRQMKNDGAQRSPALREGVFPRCRTGGPAEHARAPTIARQAGLKACNHVLAIIRALMTNVRYRVLWMAFLLAIVTFLDRVCISIAAPYMMEDLGLTMLQMSLVFSAFTLAYSLFEVPSGWMGDVMGPRRVLTRIVLWWSAFTMLTGAVQGYRSLLAVRFLFGAGEAGAFPNAVRSFSLWFPARESGRANGVLFFGSRLGGALTAPLALALIQWWGWRASFVAFGCIGVVWAAVWYWS